MKLPKARSPHYSISHVGGYEIRTAIWVADKPNSGKTMPLLIFNGIGANIEMLNEFACQFNDRDIITFDLPGVGGSPDRHIPYKLRWVCKTAKRILSINGYDKVDVMGISWGGTAAQQFAWQYKSVTHKLILCATTPGVFMVPGRPSTLIKMLSPRRYKDQHFLKKNFKAIYGDNPLHMTNFSDHMIPPSRKGYLYQMLSLTGWTSLPFIHRLSNPALVIAGENDRIVPKSNAIMIHKLLRKSQLAIIANAGHLFLFTKARESEGIIRKFLN